MTFQPTDVVIESGVPLPAAQTSWPFLQMKVGDSFILPLSARERLHGAIQKFRKNGHKDYKFSVRKQGAEFCRLWRVA